MYFPSKNDRNGKRKSPCKYGANCYQKSKEHLEKYDHSEKDQNSTEAKTPPKRLCTRSNEKNKNLVQTKLSVLFSKKPSVTKTKADDSHVRSDTSSFLSKERENVSDRDDEFSMKKESPVNKNRLHYVSDSNSSDEDVEIRSKHNTKHVESSDVISNGDISVNATCSKYEKKEHSYIHSTTPLTSSMSTEECDIIVKNLFLVHMPADFYSFWDFCLKICPKKPTEALKALQVHMVGPFDVLSGALNKDTESSIAVRHWRYFYDPPEFQTILNKTGSDLFHIGYFRDEPLENPRFVGYNYASKDCVIKPIGNNIFAAVSWCINESRRNATPFGRTAIDKLKNSLDEWANKHGYSLGSSTSSVKSGSKKVADTYHKAGIVVPYDNTTTIGYRPLSIPTLPKKPTGKIGKQIQEEEDLLTILNRYNKEESDEGKKMLMSKIHEVIRWASIGADEGDYGTTLELGIDLFCFGSTDKAIEKMITRLLNTSYELLNRQNFIIILEAHLQNRKKGGDLSVVQDS